MNKAYFVGWFGMRLFALLVGLGISSLNVTLWFGGYCLKIRDGSEDKGTYSSSRAHKFESQHPHQASHNGPELQFQVDQTPLASVDTCTQCAHR